MKGSQTILPTKTIAFTMPIQMQESTSQNVEASFHVVTGADAKFDQNRAELRIETFVDQTAFEQSADPVLTRRRTVSGDNYVSYFGRSVLQEKGNDPVTQAEKFLTQATQEFGAGTIV